MINWNTDEKQFKKKYPKEYKLKKVTDTRDLPKMLVPFNRKDILK